MIFLVPPYYDVHFVEAGKETEEQKEWSTPIWIKGGCMGCHRKWEDRGVKLGASLIGVGHEGLKNFVAGLCNVCVKRDTTDIRDISIATVHLVLNYSKKKAH